MLVTRRYNQHRRDLSIDLECENCHVTTTIRNAYDDRNYWDNVVPSIPCKKCGASTNSIGAKAQAIPTRYPEGVDV